MSLHALRGMNDILPPEISLWQEVEQKARELFARYRYEEIRTPLLEEMGLFTRSIGDTTNIVEKEMYVFQDRNDKWVALRPEGTASVIRAYVEHNIANENPVARYYYMGPMYRHERPQKGRYRQFYQLGVEVIGIASPRLDAEVIHMLDLFFKNLGLKNVELEINSLGCPICRPKFLGLFLDFLRKNEGGLCTDCRRRMERNSLRALDCNNEGCRQLTAEGPSIQESLCRDCEENFDKVIETLGLLGTCYRINPKIVRGLDYYIRTTFEFTSSGLGAQNALAGGGRYDGLIRLMGGPNAPGLGFAIGMERLIETLKQERGQPKEVTRRGVFIASLGEKALMEALRLSSELRSAGLTVDMDHEGKSLKSQMRYADKTGARYVVIVGDDEIKKKKAALRDLSSQAQGEVAFGDLAAHLKQADLTER